MHIALAGPASPRAFAAELDVDPAFLPSGLGGTPVNLLAKALLAEGHHVSIVTCCPEVSSATSTGSSNLEIHCVPWRTRARDRALTFFAREVDGIAERLRRLSPDIVHAHWTYEYSLAALHLDEPVVTTIHDSPTSVLRHHRDAYRFIRLLMAAKVRLAQPHLTAVSPYVAQQWSRGLRDRRPIEVIPNIACGFEGTSAPGPRRILTVGNDDPLKNVRAALQAFKLVRRDLPDAQLVLVGPGLTADGTFAAQAAARDELDGVKLLGPLPHRELLRQMSISTIMLHPSREEAQCMVINEALASHLPVIAGRHSGGVAWSLDDGAAGRLVDVNSPTELASAAVELLASLQSRDSLIEAGIQLVRDRYSPTAVAVAYARTYERAIEAHKRGPLPPDCGDPSS